MHNYAWILINSNKSLTEAPNVLIFGLDTPSNVSDILPWKKIAIKINFLCILLFLWISYVFLCFFNFIISIVFWMEIVRDIIRAIKSTILIHFIY